MPVTHRTVVRICQSVKDFKNKVKYNVRVYLLEMGFVFSKEQLFRDRKTLPASEMVSLHHCRQSQAMENSQGRVSPHLV